jgi:predicted nucleic acid-binding protein
MRAFVDTSSLFKKYVEEPGSEDFNRLLEDVSEIIIAPITLLEVHSILERRLREKSLKSSDAKWIEKEFFLDYSYFGVVDWNDDLQKECVRIIRKYQLKVLDSIQLSAAILAKVSLFITSDKRLFEASGKELLQVTLV